MRRCSFCFKEFEDQYSICPFCGKEVATKPLVENQLFPGTVLAERYVIGLAEGAGGFGIVYRAWDLKLETIVAVKEFYVSRLMTRAGGYKNIIVSKKSQQEYEYRKERFLAEARNMAQFGSHRSIPNVFEFFEENNTAYIVMELLTGCTLSEYLEQHNGKIDVDFALLISNEVCNALQSMHEKNIIHRDVAPDNIFICTGKEIRIKLTDFGAAKLADSTDEVIDIILKPGYSPVEQYDKSKNIGPWTDIYALGATLYMMLTGVKPDESTNRKIQDNVVAPNQLNPAISENLNNTIMKAMAVEKHLRFKNIPDLLSALNGERKVITLKKEKRNRKVRRLVGILVACAVVTAAAFAVRKTFDTKKAEEDLKAANISVWFSVKEGSSEEDAMKEVFSDFTSKFGKVTIDYKAIPESMYIDELTKAKAAGTMPMLYESTGLPDTLLESAIDLDNVIESEQYDECLFLNQYNKYYTTKKQIPLAIEIPVAYVITSGYFDTEYEGNYFSDLSDFDASANLAVDRRYADFLDDNFQIANYADAAAFLDTEANSSAVLLSSSMIVNEVRNLPYEKKYVYCNNDDLKCRFTYEWSISPCSEDEQRAAEVLLSWMLGNVYQRTLMVNTGTNEQIPEIPVNEECFKTKLQYLKNLEPISEIYNHFIFRKEDEG